MTGTASRPERSATGAYARRPSRRTSASQLAPIPAATVAGSKYTSSGWGEAPLGLVLLCVANLNFDRSTVQLRCQAECLRVATVLLG